MRESVGQKAHSLLRQYGTTGAIEICDQALMKWGGDYYGEIAQSTRNEFRTEWREIKHKVEEMRTTWAK